jgi:hypothetical protein
MASTVCDRQRTRGSSSSISRASADEFLTSPLRAEILALREAEYQRLAARRAG